MLLKEIFCQDNAISILQKAFAADKLAHAYIFAGLEGVGKFKTAREWAKLQLCKHPVIEKNGSADFADSCGSCRSCQSFEANSHPDFNHVYKELREFTIDGKGKPAPVDLSIDVIREFLIDKVSTRPTLSQRKVFIVSESEKLNAASQNSLLKVLEEPPGYCSIILLCTRLERLLPTIRSRCQIIRFGPIAEDKIIAKLEELGLEEKQAQYFGRLAAGSLGWAYQWAKLELADANLYHFKKHLVNSLTDYELADALKLAQELLDKSKQIAALWTGLETTTSKTDISRRAQKSLIQIIITALSDAMRLKITPAKGLINFDQQQQIGKLARHFAPEQAAEKIADCYQMLRWVDSAVNERLIFEQLLLNLANSDIIEV